MENTEIHYEMTVSHDLAQWNEKITGFRNRYGEVLEPETDAEALEVAKRTIDFFNATLRPGESERELRCVQRVETKVIDLMEYN